MRVLNFHEVERAYEEVCGKPGTVQEIDFILDLWNYERSGGQSPIIWPKKAGRRNAAKVVEYLREKYG